MRCRALLVGFVVVIATHHFNSVFSEAFGALGEGRGFFALGEGQGQGVFYKRRRGEPALARP